MKILKRIKRAQSVANSSTSVRLRDKRWTLKRIEIKSLSLFLVGLLLSAIFLVMMSSPTAHAQTETDYAVQSQPDPLVDGTSKVGSTSSPLANAQTQDYTYEDISEGNVATPATTTYDFSSGAGTNKWAKTNANVDELAAPYTTIHFDGSPPEGAWTDITYANIQSLNQVWQLADGTSGDYAALQYKLVINESTSTMTNIDITQTVYVQTAGTTLGVWVWNFGTSAWVQVGTNYTVNSTASPGVTFTRSITSGFTNYINASGLMYVIVVANTANIDYRLDYIKFVVTYTQLDYRLNWEHRVTGIGVHDVYRVRIYGYADAGETFSIYVWNGSTWADNGYNLPVGAGAWVDYQIPSDWVIAGAVSIKYDDDTDGDATAQSVHIDYCEIRGTTAAAFDFSVYASPSSLTIWQGDTGTSTISVTLTSGTPQTVSLSGSWVGTAPSGVTPTFSPSSGTPTYDSFLTFTTTQAATVGTFTYRVTGLSDVLNRTVDITLTINELTFSFSLSASPDSLTLMRGDNATSTISLGLLVGTAETVSLSGSWVGTTPIAVSAGLSPSSGSPPFSSILTFTTTSAASAGVFTYRVSGTSGDLTRTDDITVTVSASLALTLATDNESYLKGHTIQVSGTVKTPKGNFVSSGTATIQFSSGDWSQQSTVQISDGAFSDNYTISYADPVGTWTVTISAQDNLNNSGSTSKNITVVTPSGTAYYNVDILSPLPGVAYSRGEKVLIATRVTEGSVAVENAGVTFTAPDGKKIVLSETAPGTYSTQYTIDWGDPLSDWYLSVEGQRMTENTLKAGGNYLKIEVEPATLQVNIISPAESALKEGESVEVKVEVSYPDGRPVENAAVIARTSNGENLNLVAKGSGVYSTTYTVSSEDIGGLTLQISVADSSGNLGSKSSTVTVVAMGAAEVVVFRYWWALLSVIIGVGVVSAYVVHRMRVAARLDNIKKEMTELDKLEKQAVIDYFKNGSITRNIFDDLVKGYEERRADLEMEEKMLESKVRKRAKKKKIRGKRSRL